MYKLRLNFKSVVHIKESDGFRAPNHHPYRHQPIRLFEGLSEPIFEPFCFTPWYWRVLLAVIIAGLFIWDRHFHSLLELRFPSPPVGVISRIIRSPGPYPCRVEPGISNITGCLDAIDRWLHKSLTLFGNSLFFFDNLPPSVSILLTLAGSGLPFTSRMKPSHTCFALHSKFPATCLYLC